VKVTVFLAVAARKEAIVMSDPGSNATLDSASEQFLGDMLSASSFEEFFGIADIDKDEEGDG
jgi:hypothetical protein